MVKPSTEVRWAVRVQYYWHGRSEGPFLAGRYYFNMHGDTRSADDHPPVATFRTRAQARERAAKIRKTNAGWRVTARPVRVIVETRLA